MPKAIRYLIALMLLSPGSSVLAHPAPFSYLDLRLGSDGMSGSVVVHDLDAAHELGIAKPESLHDPAIVASHREALTRLIESRVRIEADGEAIAFRWGGAEILAESQSLRLPFTSAHSARSTLELDLRLFPYDPKHQTFVNFYENGELRQQAILDAERTTLKFYRETLQGRLAVVTTFIRAGAQHILIGLDHVLFLVGLMLLGGSWWRLATIVTAFTLGHSITLSLAVLGVVNVPSSIVEPVIALSIVVVGIDNLLVSLQRHDTSHGIGSRDLRPWLAGVFGLIHGFGFASVLSEFGLPREALGWSLAAFNVGVEIGQLAVVLTTLLVGRIATKVLAQILSPGKGTRVSEGFLTVGSYLVVAAGVYWFVQRIGGVG